MRITKKGGKYDVVKANLSSGGPSGSGQRVIQSTSALLGGETKGSILEGIIEEKSPRQVQGLYRDIYMHDPIAGACVDLKATMPWSDFTLEGCSEEQGEKFEENISRLNLRNLHTELSTDQMVTGAFVGSLVYDPDVKGFQDIIPFNYADCQIRDVPLYSEEPMISLQVGPELKQFATDKSDEAKRIQSRIPAAILEHFRTSKVIDLKPISTIYVPRTTMSSVQSGVSYYRRILPIWLLERLLYRGTYSEATRRQRSTLHITAGDEEWIPNQDDLADLVGLFQMTEMDPVSSVVATRNNVQASEIRAGGDFWKWTDVVDQLGAMKMRALGINETFLSGEGSYNTMETALSVFLEDLRTYRDKTSFQIYGSKLFPLISQVNNFLHDEKDKKDKGLNKETAAYLQDVQMKLNDASRLVIPRIKWHKELGATADTAYMDVLDRLESKGWPVTLRMWAAASGGDFDAITKQLDQDVKDRTTLADYREKLGEIDTPEKTNPDDEYASMTPMKRLLSRDFGESGEIFERTVTGKKKYVHRQGIAQAAMNEMVVKAMENLRDPNVFKQALSRKTAWAKTLYVPGMN